jgi:regulation of enolase protein 1 (concanavalin A-like superfamily)
VAHPLAAGDWLNPTPGCVSDAEGVRIATAPGTDLWQRTYYGFRTDNAPALLVPVEDDMTLTVRAAFGYRRRYDQAGVLVRLDADSWAKASIEHEDAARSRLGCVVTSLGYSDWSTRDIASTDRYWYRLSRRGPDFRVEAGPDGTTWEQLRIFHLHPLGETIPPAPSPRPGPTVLMGVYACSPEESSFEALFDRITLQPSVWAPHT